MNDAKEKDIREVLKLIDALPKVRLRLALQLLQAAQLSKLHSALYAASIVNVAAETAAHKERK